MKSSVTAMTLILCGALTACSGNPLLGKPMHATALMLSQASGDAMRLMGPKESSRDDQYLRCLEQKTPTSFSCSTLYREMRVVLKKQGMNVTVANLTDPKLVDRLFEDLQELSYLSL
jgi:hypothetical protein